jgi:two-component system, LytTR family, response regulator
MNPFKVIIADDDEPSRTILSAFVQSFPEYKVVSEATNAEELIQSVIRDKPDIVLVDIHMPGLNGVEAVKACKEISPSIQAIFTTAYDDFAVEAFKVSAVDYIIKPIERTRLFMALEKAKKSLRLYKNLKNPNQKEQAAKLAIKSSNTFLYLLTEDILFAEKVGRKTIIHTKDRTFEVTESLQDLEEVLGDSFFKTHRSYLVNLKKISRINSSGETYLGFFQNSEKAAHISKLKINEVQSLIGM